MPHILTFIPSGSSFTHFFSSYTLFHRPVVRTNFSIYVAPSGPGMPNFCGLPHLPLTLYALNFSNYTAPSSSLVCQLF